jgi:uncharacterized protein YqgC (DUF456 family)
MLGGAGLVLPVLPGVVLLIIGLSFLSLEFQWRVAGWAHCSAAFPSLRRNFRDFLPAIRSLYRRTHA